MIFNYKYLVLTCINEDISIFSDRVSKILPGADNLMMTWEINESDLEIKRIYFPEPPHGGRHLANFLIWEPLNNKGTTIFFVNYQDGWYTLLNLYAEHYKILCIQVGLSDDKVISPMYKFYYNDGSEQRILQSYKDGGKWMFFQNGKVLPFEQQEFYKRHIIKERLPNSLIIDYLGKMNWDINNTEFWMTDKPVYNFRRIS